MEETGRRPGGGAERRFKDAVTEDNEVSWCERRICRGREGQ